MSLVTSSITEGSRSTKTALGTCLPVPVSAKKVLKESSPPPTVLSEGIVPSGWMPAGEGSGTLVTGHHRDQFNATRKPSCTYRAPDSKASSSSSSSALRPPTVLQTVKFPAGISNLATGLAHVDADALSLAGDNLLRMFSYQHIWQIQ